MPRLRPRYEAFCHAYLDSANAAEAARAAGYSERSAAQQATGCYASPR